MTRALAAVFAAGLASGAAAAADVDVEAAWARASAGPARNGVAYVTLANRGGPTALVGAETPVAARAELHAHVMDGDIARMRQVERVELAAGGRVAFAPGGLHLMLMELDTPLAEGASFPLTLRFADGDTRTVEVAVGGVAAAEPPAPQGAHSH